jgi:hypothetical protein
MGYAPASTAHRAHESTRRYASGWPSDLDAGDPSDQPEDRR